MFDPLSQKPLTSSVVHIGPSMDDVLEITVSEAERRHVFGGGINRRDRRTTPYPVRQLPDHRVSEEPPAYHIVYPLVDYLAEDWKSLAQELGLTIKDLYEISELCDGLKAQCREMFNRWLRKEGNNLSKLRCALINVGYVDVIDMDNVKKKGLQDSIK